MLSGHTLDQNVSASSVFGLCPVCCVSFLADRDGAQVNLPRAVRTASSLPKPCPHPHVGAENPVTSCDVHVLVDEAAEPVSS
jgi:hypothetical protein